MMLWRISALQWQLTCIYFAQYMAVGAICVWVFEGVIHMEDQALHSTAYAIYSWTSCQLHKATVRQVHMLAQLPIAKCPGKVSCCTICQGLRNKTGQALQPSKGTNVFVVSEKPSASYCKCSAHTTYFLCWVCSLFNAIGATLLLVHPSFNVMHIFTAMQLIQALV